MTNSILCDKPASAARQRYNRRVFWLTGAYAVLVIGLALLLKAAHPPVWVRYLMGLASAAPAVGTIMALGAYLAEEPDEFRRKLLAEAMLWGTGATMVVTTVWGFVEMFAEAPHLMLALIFPFFSVAMGAARAILTRRYS